MKQALEAQAVMGFWGECSSKNFGNLDAWKCNFHRYFIKILINPSFLTKLCMVNILAADTGAESSELPGLMGNREWSKTIIIVDSVRACSTE